MYSESKVYQSLGPNSSLSTNMPSNSTFSSSNMGTGGPVGVGRIGYTPESHVSKPRNINSNEVRQRTMDGNNYINGGGGIDSSPNGYPN